MLPFRLPKRQGAPRGLIPSIGRHAARSPLFRSHAKLLLDLHRLGVLPEWAWAQPTWMQPTWMQPTWMQPD